MTDLLIACGAAALIAAALWKLQRIMDYKMRHDPD